MNLRIQNDCENIDWNVIPEILKTVGMGYKTAEVHKASFENSYAVTFVFDGDKLIGLGRAISDGVYQAALYDIAILPAYQRQGIGSMIVKDILKRVPDCNVILYANIGKEKFYETMNFKKMRTAMALFRNAENMRARGFIE
jgi:ribosomal protein S18 acetylase RimI-like enzyme